MSGKFNTFNIGGVNPIVLISSGDGPTLLENLDISNTVYLGTDSGVSATGPSSIPLAALADLQLDGTVDVWAICNVGQSASVAVIPGGLSSTASPAQIAEQISIAGINAPVPTFLKAVGTFLANTAWGPVTVPIPNGGSYLLSISANILADIAVTDVTVQHLDAANNVVYTDFFGGVNVGNGDSPVTSIPGPVLLRGNLYGTQLKISGLTGSAAFINAVLGSSGLLSSGVTVNLYTLPFNIPDPTPKVFTGGVLLGSFVGSTPGQLLAAFDGEIITSGTATTPTPMVPYAGPCSLTMQQTTVTTTPTNVVYLINNYTVANGSATVSRFVFTNAAANIGYVQNINLPSCWNVMIVQNNDGAQNTHINVSVVSEKAA